MPKVTIWIREGEDYKRWKAIKSKPQWLHNHLNFDCRGIRVKKREGLKQIPTHAKLTPFDEPTLTPPEDSA
jgi:hypothetical protein